MRFFISTCLCAATTLIAPARAQFPAAHELPGDLASGPAAGEQRHSAIAQGNNQSLIVYEDHRAILGDTVAYSSSGVAVLEAARFDSAGTLIDTVPISVRRGTNSPRDPHVAWNGSTWLVVWDELVRHQFESDRGVFAARVDAAGHVLDDPPMLLADVSYVDESYPVVASDGTRWAVAWSSLVGGADAIQGCTIDPSGTVGPVSTMMTSTIGFYFPVGFEMAWSNGRYLFVSQHFLPGGQFNDAVGQLFDANLAKIGTEFAITFGSSISDVQVAGNGSDFCVTWRHANASIRATPVSAAGNVLVQGGVDLMGPAPGYSAYQLPAVAWDGTDWAVAFGTGSGSNTAMNVSRLSTNGTLVGGAPVTIAQGSVEMSRPACAPIAGGVQIVWDDARNNPNPIASWASDRMDVYSAVMTASGAVNTPVDVTVSPPAQLDPQIAGDAVQGYLAAFFSVTQSTTTVNVQRLDTSGYAIDPQPIALFSGPRTLHNLDLAWSGTNWMLVWEEFTLGGSTIYGMRIAPNGNALDASPISILPGSGASIAAVNGDYLIVATNEPVLHQRYVYTRRVRASDGALLDAAPVQRTNVGFDTQATVAAFNDRWILAWAHSVTHDASFATIRSMIVSASGIGSVADVAGSGTSSNGEPVLATDGVQSLLVWTSGGDVLGRRILNDGTKLDTDAGFVISSANNQQFAPHVAWNGGEFVVAFADYRAHVNPLETGIGDVYAARVDAGGTVLDPNGIVVANDVLTPEGRPCVAGGAGTTVVAFDALLAGAPFGNWRVSISAEAPTTGTGFCFGDGSGTACPCGNASASGTESGCTNSIGPAGKLTADGHAAISGDTVVLRGSSMPNSSALYFQGTAETAGGAGAVFGDGLRCASGTIVRLGARSNVGGASTYPAAGDPSISQKGAVSAPGVRTYQVWYRNAAAFCTPSTFNLSNGWRLTWAP